MSEPYRGNLTPAASDGMYRAAQDIAEIALKLQHDGHCGPRGVTDRLTYFGTENRFGNCRVTIKCELLNERPD